MLSMSGIYQIRNTVNGKRYVGSAKVLRKRWAGHKSSLRRGVHHSKHLQNSWDKHGEDCIVFEPLLICSAEDLIFYEQRAIDTIKPEYNNRPRADSNLGYTLSAEKRRIMQAKRDATDWRQNVSRSRTGIKRSEADKAQISRKMKEVSASPEWRENIRKRQTGTKRSAETLKKLSDNKKKHYSIDSNKDILRETQRNRADLKRYEFQGKVHTISEWATVTGISVHAIRQRLDDGWSVEDTLTKQSAKAFISHNGESKSLKQWADDYGLKSGTLARRLKSGWTMEKALSEPLRVW